MNNNNTCEVKHLPEFHRLLTELKTQLDLMEVNSDEIYFKVKFIKSDNSNIKDESIPINECNPNDIIEDFNACISRLKKYNETIIITKNALTNLVG